MGRLSGKNALITGGASGLGLAVATRFLEEDARVGILDRSAERLAEAKALFGDAVVYCQGDVTDLGDNELAVAQVVERFGSLDTFIGNAGVWDHSVSLVDLPRDSISNAFDEIMGINLKGYLLGAKAALTPLVRSRGSLLFTVSFAGFHSDGGGPLYTMSKHGVVGLIRQLANELAPHVRVNGVAPGAVGTDLRGPQALGQADRSLQELSMEELGGVVPLGYVPEPHEHTGSYVFLASPEDASPLTGVILNTDGGLAIRGLWQARGGDELLSKLNEEGR